MPWPGGRAAHWASRAEPLARTWGQQRIGPSSMPENNARVPVRARSGGAPCGTSHVRVLMQDAALRLPPPPCVRAQAAAMPATARVRRSCWRRCGRPPGQPLALLYAAVRQYSAAQAHTCCPHLQLLPSSAALPACVRACSSVASCPGIGPTNNSCRAPRWHHHAPSSSPTPGILLDYVHIPRAAGAAVPSAAPAAPAWPGGPRQGCSPPPPPPWRRCVPTP